MNGKETAKKIWMKIGFGILFVAACFTAMYILMEFHEEVFVVIIAAVLLLVSAFLFLNAVFSDKAKNWAPQEDNPVRETETISTGGDGEFRLKITKHMKEMESTQKELIDVLKNQNNLIQNQIENLEHEIYMLSEKQANQTKSIIKFNKENARQLAISERETLEYVMIEIRNAITDNTKAVVKAPAPTPAEEQEPAVPEFSAEPEVQQKEEAPAPVVEDLPVMEDLAFLTEELFDEEIPADALPAEEVQEEIPVEEPVMEVFAAEELPMEEPVAEEIPMEIPAADELEIPELPEDMDLSELFDIPGLFDNEESVEETPMEEIPLPEPVEEDAPAAEETVEEPAADPLAGLSSDPNAMMTPEDIAKLLAAMGQ